MANPKIDVGTIDVHVGGTLSARTTQLSAGSVTDNSVAANANLAASKLNQAVHATGADPSATTTASGSRVIHVANAAGSIKLFEVGTVVLNIGAATIVVDLKKNNVSILTAVVTLDSSNVVRVSEAATINTPDYVDGDVFEIVVTATAGGGTVGTGLFWKMVGYEVAH